MKVLFCESYDSDIAIQLKSIQNKSVLHLTATSSLQRVRNGMLKEFYNAGRIISFAKFQNLLLTEIKSAGGYLTNSDIHYIITKLIKQHFQDENKAIAYSKIKKDLHELFLYLHKHDVDFLSVESIEKFKIEQGEAAADIYELYNFFLARIKKIKKADDELLSFDNQEGDFLLSHEMCSQKENSVLSQYNAVIFDGFLFFNDDQKDLLKKCITQNKEIIIITKAADFLKDNLLMPLSKELNTNIEFITVKKNRLDTKFETIADNLFTANIMTDLDGCEFIEPFISREHECRYIAKRISKLLEDANGGGLEQVIERLNNTAVVARVGVTGLDLLLDEALKDNGLFILKNNQMQLPQIVFSQEEFIAKKIVLDGKEITGRQKKVELLRNAYNRMKVNTGKRAFINYPVGQFILEIYNIIADGMSCESFKKILYSNWQFNVGESKQKYDNYIREFSFVETFFQRKNTIAEWVAESEQLKKDKYSSVADSCYSQHPLTAVSNEAIDFFVAQLKSIEEIINSLNKVSGSIMSHTRANHI